MATIINNPDSTDTGSNTAIMAIFVIVIILLLVGLFVWPGWLVSRSGVNPTPNGNNPVPDQNIEQNIEQKVPSDERQFVPTVPQDQDTQINIPDRLDINVDTNLDQQPNDQDDQSPTTGTNQPTL